MIAKTSPSPAFLAIMLTSAGHIIVAIIYAKNENQWETHKGAGWACIVMVWLFVIHFGWSWGPWYVFECALLVQWC
jgi:hypothetical protein